ncbi:hypothetical protein Pryu01_01241 [Paraliobacillus ryukyuensis]|uniref:Lipoprotein n=1 Tax=Paraliobacillus ryukyuensis TaxID=200904 RepID=A0A366EBU7_9BACI|nr:hypothetical protein [Paraliobacillus ryukyuensis]RBO99525.1 hypothetical protein DES48_104201 [Paraliobacillus ryukyuensis]
MKKLLLFLAVILLLISACGNGIDENVDENIAKDTMQSIEIVKDAINNNTVVEDLPDEDLRIMSKYKDKYEQDDSLNGVDEQIIAFGITVVSKYARSSLLQSEVDKIAEDIEVTEKMISTGEPKFEDF